MSKNNLTNVDYWNNLWDHNKFKIAPQDDPIRKWLELHIPKGQGKCIEIGCIPGRYLAVFGEKGYELFGIDWTQRVTQDLPDWLLKCGYSVGEFYCKNFEEFDTKDRYDIVCSFGFIEHFTRWDNILLRHANLVKDNGYIIIETPNFRGYIQRFIHILLDKKNFNNHNIDAMQPSLWQNILILNGFEIIYCGYIGGFDYWVELQDRNFIQKVALKLLMRGKKYLTKISFTSSLFSPYIGIIAKKII